MGALEHVAVSFEDSASYRITFNRDERDDYSFRLEALSRRPRRELRKEDVWPLIPRGGRWLQAVGWHNYFGLQLYTGSGLWLCLGAEVVRPHATRGAFPNMTAYMFCAETPPVIALEALADRLSEHTGMAFQPPDSWQRGILSTQSKTPEEHVGVESWLIRQAARCYSANEPLLFRSLVLSADEVYGMSRFCPKSTWFGRTFLRVFDQPDPRPQICYSGFLMATVPAIRETFSQREIAWLEEYDLHHPLRTTTWDELRWMGLPL